MKKIKQIEEKLHSKIREAEEQMDLVKTGCKNAAEGVKGVIENLKTKIDCNTLIHLTELAHGRLGLYEHDKSTGEILDSIVENVKNSLLKDIEWGNESPYYNLKYHAENILKNTYDTFGTLEESISDEKNKIGCVNNSIKFKNPDMNYPKWRLSLPDCILPSYILDKDQINKLVERSMTREEFEKLIMNSCQYPVVCDWRKRFEYECSNKPFLESEKDNKILESMAEELKNSPYRPIQCQIKQEDPNLKLTELTESEWEKKKEELWGLEYNKHEEISSNNINYEEGKEINPNPEKHGLLGKIGNYFKK